MQTKLQGESWNVRHSEILFYVNFYCRNVANSIYYFRIGMITAAAPLPGIRFMKGRHILIFQFALVDNE